MAVLLLAFLVVLPEQADAATITTNTTDNELNADGDCSLREAFQAANTNAAVDACAAGELAPTVDVLNFSVTGTIGIGPQLTVTDALNINGPGAANLTISAGSGRVMEVGSRATLDLEGVTIADGYLFIPPADVGAGILNFGTLTVANTTFSANFAAGGSNNGGAIANSGGTVTVTSSTFSGNYSGGFGGGISNTGGGALTVSDSSFSANSSNEGGGGIYSSGESTVNLTDTTFSGNSADFGGGGIANSVDSTLTITNATFDENSATTGGGGGISNAGNLTVTNATFSGNSTNGGGGINHYGGGGGTATVTNSTFSGNSGSIGGGAIRSSDGALTLENSIVANSPEGGNCFGTITDGGGNLQHPGTDCGATITSADPLLDPAGLQNNGGPTETITLQPGSPAINAAVSANCPATDQRGEERPQGAACDIGAVELVTGYPRPKATAPLRFSLVPAYLACSSPNRTHGPPMADASCTPPAKLSQYATVGTPDANFKPTGFTGSVRMAALAGSPFTPGDQADVALVTNITDVRTAGDLSDYGGEVLVAVGMRITDKLNGPSLAEPATVVDNALSWPIQCAPTEDPNIGSTCASATTADALVPGTVGEGKRGVWALKQIQVADGGEDGQAATTGDNTPFLKQGILVP